jgi:hypothetical protein
LGLESSNYIQFGNWDSLKKGLLSGEKLQYDLRRLENAYLEENKREYEIIKHISLTLLDPLALLTLKANGTCEFEIPEVLYDMDQPGQYFRRIKSVSISLPCIAGPYTSVSSTLSLVNSRYRKNTTGTEYTETPQNDSRFNYFSGPIQSIASSHGQNDSGIFELNFRDERYLPFEGTGAIGNWRLELPTEIRQFDYNTISDIIIHVKYTAREGGNELKNLVNSSLKNKLHEIGQQLGEQGLHIAINMKHDLTTEWHLLKKTGSVDLLIDKSRFPYMVQPFEAEIENVMFVAKVKDNPTNVTLSIVTTSGTTETIHSTMENLEIFDGSNSDFILNSMFNLSIEDVENLEELIMVVKYRFDVL